MDKDVNEESQSELNLTFKDVRNSLRAGREQTRNLIVNNVENVEIYYPHFVQDLNLYTVRSAKLRDAGDVLAKSLSKYAETELPVIKAGLTDLAECLKTVQDHRHALVDRLENKVVPALSEYEISCQEVRKEVVSQNTTHRNEMNCYKQYASMKNHSPREKVQAAKEKYKRLSHESREGRENMYEQLSEFERKKVRDLKEMFGEFLLNEMLFFTRALERYTQGYQDLMIIDEEKDVQFLRSSIRSSASGISAIPVTSKNSETICDSSSTSEIYKRTTVRCAEN